MHFNITLPRQPGPNQSSFQSHLTTPLGPACCVEKTLLNPQEKNQPKIRNMPQVKQMVTFPFTNTIHAHS